MTEEQSIAYFENLAAQHPSIQHFTDQKKFFYIVNPDELNSFDEALRNIQGEVAMLMVVGEGEFDDNNSENHIDEVNIQLYFLIRKRNDKLVIKIFNDSKKIMLEVLARTKTDFRGNEKARFRIDKMPYKKVGPMNEDWYGYTTMVTFICPFGFSGYSGNWLDN